jgi:hypothetical protein
MSRITENLISLTSPYICFLKKSVNEYPTNMSFLTKAITLFILPLVYAAPTLPFPPPAELTEGYVNTNISLIAGGSLPNVSTDAQYSTAGITALQLLASLENIEAFFYADAIQNITSGVYNIGDLSYNDTLEVISKIAAVWFSLDLTIPRLHSS